jgi:hypothetical protein
MKAWHDYHISGYRVQSIDRIITIDLVWNYQSETNIPSAKVIFSGVQGYEFRNDGMGSIVLDFEEYDIDEFFETFGAAIEKSYATTAAFGGWAANMPNAKEKFKNSNAKAYVLNASYGLEGWVISSAVEEVYA